MCRVGTAEHLYVVLRTSNEQLSLRTAFRVTAFFVFLPLYSSSKNALVGSGEVSVLDEAGCIRLREESGYLAEQGLALDVAVGAEACANAVEVGIAVSGVAAKFIGSCSGKGREDLCERGGVQLPGG